MTSIREQALAALYKRLGDSLAVQVRRADGNAVSIPSAGATVTMEDGSPEAEPMMSPLQYAIEHPVPITIEASGTARVAIDETLQGIAAAVAADPTLGGLIDWSEITDMDTDTEAPEGAGGQKMPPRRVANLTITMQYVASTPVG